MRAYIIDVKMHDDVLFLNTTGSIAVNTEIRSIIMQTSGENSEHIQDELDPWSDSYNVNRITIDRDELTHVLKGMADDPRVQCFMLEYESNYEKLIISNSNRLSIRSKVRALKASRGVSCAKSQAVEEIFKNTDDHISQLRREMNVVYHQLIEVQEQEDSLKQTIAALNKEIKDMNDKIREREQDIPANQLKLRDRLEARYSSRKEERDKVIIEVEHLREEIAEATARSTQMELNHLRLEEKIAATQLESLRVANAIAKECQQKARLTAALCAAMSQLENREADMAAIRQRLEETKDHFKSTTEATFNTTIKTEKVLMSIQALSAKIRNKQYEYEHQVRIVSSLEAEVEQRQQEYKMRRHEMETLTEQSEHVDKVRRAMKNKIKEVEMRKEMVIESKETAKKKNQDLLSEIETTRRKLESATKEQTDLLKQRDFIRKNLMRVKAEMKKDHTLLILHQLTNKRLTQDNACLEAQGREQKRIVRRLEQDRNGYIHQAMVMTRKVIEKTEEDRRAMEMVFSLMKQTSGEELKLMEMQNLYESTRNEHVIYTRHILQLRGLISTLKTKALAMTYETQKLVQERDYRDECLLKEEVAMQKLNRQIFVLKSNLKDLKETNARTKLIIENQDLEEKKLVRITRIVKTEKVREMKGMERVVRDIEGLDLALTRRYQQLNDLYKMVKLKQSLLEKGENMYKMRLKDHVAVRAELRQTKAKRRLDKKNRTIVDRLMNCVKMLQGQLEKVQLRSKGLMEELSHPRNIHRWRNLLGRDPESYQSVRNLHKLRHQIQDKVHGTSSTLTKIHLLDRQYISLTTSVMMQPSPETVLQLKLYQQDLSTRYKHIKRLTEELREALQDKANEKGRHGFIQRKLSEMRTLWFKHKEEERKRQAMERLQAAGPLSLLPGPEGLATVTKDAIAAFKDVDRRSPPFSQDTGVTRLTTNTPVSWNTRDNV